MWIRVVESNFTSVAAVVHLCCLWPRMKESRLANTFYFVMPSRSLGAAASLQLLMKVLEVCSLVKLDATLEGLCLRLRLPNQPLKSYLKLTIR